MDINGIAIKATLIVDGKEVELELGCVNEKIYLRKDDEWIPKLVWFKKGTDQYLDGSFYSGGLTGFGKSNFQDLSSDFTRKQILTKNPYKALEIMEQYEQKEKEEKELLNQRKILAVAMINVELPSATYIGETNYVVMRNKAIFNPKYSSKIECNVYIFNDKNKRLIYLDNYKRKDGKIIKKKIIEDFGSFELYEKIVAEEIKVKKAIQNIVDRIVYMKGE